MGFQIVSSRRNGRLLPTMFVRVEFFSSTSKLVKNVNRMNLLFLPKTRGALRIQDFRSIALCNTVYKVLTKVTVFPMQNILPCIIGDQHGAFMKDRTIHDQVILANEVIDTSS